MSGCKPAVRYQKFSERTSKQAQWCCVVACNCSDTLNENLLASPDLASGHVGVSVQMNKSSSSFAYNQGLDVTSEPVIVFAHQDVYFPKGWGATLEQRISDLDRMDPDWAVAGVMGIMPDGQPNGQLWSTGLGREIGQKFDTPMLAASLDEVVLIVRRASGLRFDENLPSFHLYGTDIVQTALKTGKKAYIIHAPLVHNSRAVQSLNAGFTSAYRYMQQKWLVKLPIKTPVTIVDKSGDSLVTSNRWLRRHRLRRWIRRVPGLIRFAPDGFFRSPCPKTIARRLRYE